MSADHPQDAFATRAVHAGLTPDPSFRSVIPAIHQTSTYAQTVPGQFVGDYDYSRSANPTRAALELALGELEGGQAVAFSSGMAAEHALITVTCEAGSHMVLPDDLYGGTYRLVDKVLSRWGLRYDLVGQTDLDAVSAAVRGDTRLIWVESPTNPLLNVVDIEQVVARRRNALVTVDNTFATPANQRPLEHGADFVVHSTTKYLGGHSDVVGGVVVTRDPEWYERLRFVQNAVGAVPGPFDCFLVHRGLRTLYVRMEAHARSAAAVVAPAEGHPRRAGRALARLQRHGELPPRGGDRDRRPHAAVHPGRVAGRRGVAHRGAPGDDPPVRGGLGRRRPTRSGAPELRHRGARGPGGRPAPGDRRLTGGLRRPRGGQGGLRVRDFYNYVGKIAHLTSVDG